MMVMRMDIFGNLLNALPVQILMAAIIATVRKKIPTPTPFQSKIDVKRKTTVHAIPTQTSGDDIAISRAI
jgi:hypothetical protein